MNTHTIKKNAHNSTLHWQLIDQLIESCLLEQWIDGELIQETTTKQYLHILTTQNLIDSLPPVYQKCFALPIDLLVLKLEGEQSLLLMVEPAYCSPWRLIKPYFPLLYTQGNHQKLQILSDETLLLDILLANMNADIRSKLSEIGMEKIRTTLKMTYIQSQWSNKVSLVNHVYSQAHWYQTLIGSEQWASLVDRPFHPLAKCKIGFDENTYKHYMAEFNKPVTLHWYAVAKTHLMLSATSENIEMDNPAQYLLSEDELIDLNNELSQLNIIHSHIAIPVHPWQVTEIIPEMFAEDLENGTVVKLAFAKLNTWASSSIRSMFLQANTPYSIKLPLGIYALNSKRYLPALKSINGEKNQAILLKALQFDSELEKYLYLWDEAHWWGYMFPENIHDKSSTNPGFYNEKPTHLGAMLRILPNQLCHDKVRLLSMASLGVLNVDNNINNTIDDNIDGIINEMDKTSTPTKHIFDDILDARNEASTERAVINLFAQLCEVFFKTMLHCIRLGFVPEMHGQNVVVVLENHQFTGILLRDHDSVRIHLPWLNSHGIDDPDYLSPPNFRNRLYRDTPQELIFYLQTLGISVNIRAIIETMTQHYQLTENTLWQQVRDSISTCLADIDFSNEQRQILQQELLDSELYPHKTLLLPIIERGADPHGSMPAGESVTVNPLYRCI